MTRRLTILATSLLALTAGSAAAQSIRCGAEYTVQSGDTLSEIAIAAYDSAAGYQLIYSANAAVIGPNPGVIEVGSQLQIPCLDGELAASTADISQIQPEETTELLPAPEARQIRFVTATDWAPFHNQDNPQGGMVTEIVNVAMSKVAAPEDYKIDFVNDWSAHLQPLISDVAYDLSLSWFRPNCDRIEKLGEGSRFRCNNLDWSDPLYEQIVGYYTMADAAAPLSHADLFGTTICSPAGFAMFQLEEFDLVEPNVTYLRPNSTQACFEALSAGEADVVVLAADTADGAVSELGLSDQVVKHDVLDYVATIHAVTSKNNPNGVAQLALLNEGVKQLKDSGEWFAIVRRHLTEHRMKTGS